jgi:hypothetical protein
MVHFCSRDIIRVLRPGLGRGYSWPGRNAHAVHKAPLNCCFRGKFTRTPFSGDSGGSPLWASNTAGNNGATLSVQDDGNVVIYSTSGAALWSTGAAGH